MTKIRNNPVWVIEKLEFGYCLEFGAWRLVLLLRRQHVPA